MRRLLIFFLTLVFTFSIFTNTASAEILTSEKLITIDTTKQMLYVWEGGRLINQSLVSTGMYYTPTIKGENFRIYKKVPLQDMRGYYPPYKPYFIKDVPNVMYFSGAYAIHGAHWHNSFGSRYSHGCVNAPVAFSKWLFDWASTGTRVAVF